MCNRVKSLISLVFAFLPLLVIGYFHNSGSLIDEYRELFLAISLPGILYFIKYEILGPIIRSEITEPLVKIIAIGIRAMKGEKDALRKLEVLEASD